MEKIIEKYPLPWKLHNKSFQDWPCIRDANDCLVINADWADEDLLEFLVNIVNSRIDNASLPRIIDQPCECFECGWNGTIWDCEGDIDDNGRLGCPECLEIIEVITWK